LTPEGTVGSSERLRLFYGLPLPADAADGLALWAADAFGGSGRVRVVASGHLHVTLAFLGTRPARELDALRGVLRGLADGLRPPVLTVERYRETERVGMVVLADEGCVAAELQARLTARLVSLGAYRPERRRWLAHVTVARFRERPRLRPPLPALGPVSPSEAALYHSVLRSGGAQYHIVESVSLGG
jgi:2'-5' RNA ligase